MAAEAPLADGIGYPLGENGEAFGPRTERILAALNLAEKAHKGQRRASGEPYVSHCIAVAKILEGWGIEDADLLCAGLLHDAVEDGSVALSEIETSFGKRVAQWVEGVSKFRSASGQADDRETLKKVISRSYVDPRVADLKLADRLHNMRTLEPMPEKSQVAKSRETLDVYAPLAESLGMWDVKIELADLAYRYVHPEEYQAIVKEVDADPRLRPEFLAYWESNLERVLGETGMAGQVEVRRNGYFSLAEKRRQAALEGTSLPTDFREINDLVSLRVILPEVGDCYRFIGAVHGEFGERVDYDRYDDFIGAHRRTNGYQALQTTLSLPQGAVEIAVVTGEMEDFNRWGVVSLLRRGEKNLSDFVLKMVFTPTDEVRFLPKDATGVDFSYSLGERFGAQAEKLLVDGVPQPLTCVLPNASTVHVVLVDEVRLAPDAELLKYCLPATGELIRKQLILLERERYVKEGRTLLEPVLEPRGLLDLRDLGRRLPRLLYGFGCQTLEDLYLKVGGEFLDLAVVASLLDREGITKKGLGWTTVRVSGTDQRGILEDLTSWINGVGGNIIRIELAGLSLPDRTYQLRLVMEEIKSEGEESLRNRLKNDERFAEWKVV